MSKNYKLTTSHLEDLNEYNFDKLSASTKSSREQKRYLAFAHIKDGKSFIDSARMVRVTYRTLLNWVKRFRVKGIEGLKDSYGGGQQPHVPPVEYDEFRRSVLELQKNRKGGRIRGKDIADLIKEKYNKNPSKSSVYETLKKAGLVWITGRSIHPKTDQETQDDFKKTLKISSKKASRIM